MEAKGRRAPRAATPIETSVTTALSIEILPIDPADSPEPTPIPATEAAAPPAVAAPGEEIAAALAVAAPGEEVAAILAVAAPGEEAATPPAAAAPGEREVHDDFAHFGREAFAAVAESQAALARGLEAISAEMAGLARSGIDTATRTATRMLGIKTISDAIEVNALFARASFDTLVDGSARLSELGVRLAAESSQPLLARLGEGWIRAIRPGS